MPVEPDRMRITRSVLPAGLVALAVASGLLGGCGKDEPTAEEMRRDRIGSRLDATFPKAQVTCILDGLDDATMIALDRDGDLAKGSKALSTYTFVVRACAKDSTASATTTTGTKGATTTSSSTTSRPGAASTSTTSGD